MSTSSFSLPYMVHSFQKYSGLPASYCATSIKDNIKTKFKQMTKWNALVFWHQRLKQMTAFSPWIQEWQRLERVHSDQRSPGFQQLTEQGSHLSPHSAPGKQFPLFCRALGIKLTQVLYVQRVELTIWENTLLLFCPSMTGTPAEMTPKFLCRCGRCLRTL